MPGRPPRTAFVKILDRYVIKEHVGPMMFALTALTSLLLLNYVAKQFGELVGKGLAWTVIVEFFLLSIPFTVAMTLPMAVLVGTLYAFSRLASENEITALKASGVSMTAVLVPVLLGAAFIALLMVAFNDQVLPRANHRLRVLQGDIARKKPTFALREQVINEVQPGKFYLKAGHLDQSNRMREVVIYDLSVQTRRRTIYADSGWMGLTRDGRDLALTLYDGYMQELDRADPSQLQRLFYRVNLVRVPGIGNTFEKSGNDDFKSDRERSICELQDQFAQAERDRQRARAALTDALVGATREAATGERWQRGAMGLQAAPAGPPVADTAYRPGFGVGRLYCALMAPLIGGVQEAQAAEPRTAPQATAQDDQRAIEARRRARDRVLGIDPASQRPPQRARATRAADSVAALAAPTVPAGLPRVGMPAAGSPGAADTAGTRQRRDGIPAAPSAGVAPVVQPNTPAEVLGMVAAMKLRIEDSERTMDTYDVEIQKKFSLAVACIVFVLLGAPIALRFPRGGVGLTIGVSLGVFALYYVGLIAGESLANRGYLSPFWAMWGANVLFTIVGLGLLARMGKEGSTARGGDLSEFTDSLRSWFGKQARRLGVKAERRRLRT